MKPLAEVTVPELENLITNHRKKGATDAPLYLDACQELEKRKGKGLDFDKSLQIILRAASEGRFLSYKELADQSGANWGQVHYAIGSHLRNLVEYAHRRGWPLLSAIVVNKQRIGTGLMEPETLKGFIAAAHDLGIPVTDETAFLQEQQRKVFDWAKTTAQ